MSKRIFLSPPHMNGTEMALVEEAFASNWIAPLGPFVNKFEEDLGTILDRHVCALCSGTSALHLGLLTLGVGPGDRVYCSDFTFSASCNVIRYCGAEPVFIDSELDSWQMDPALLEQKLEADAKLGKLPKAVVVVDLYGISADFGRILPILAKYDIPLLEDSAEALGSKRDGKLCGTFGKVSGFSFNGNKIITTSGGGALVSDDEAIVKRARYLATQAREPKPFYHHVTIGYNYRLSNILAAIGCGQLNDLEQRVEKRRQIFEQYVCELSDIDGIGFMPEPKGAISNKWLSVITIDPDKLHKSPEDVRQAMEAENIETRWAWKPMHMQPIYENCEFVGGSVCESIFNKALCLPSGSSLSGHEQSCVCESLRKVLLNK